MVVGSHELGEAGQLAHARRESVEVQFVRIDIQLLQFGQLTDGRLENKNQVFTYCNCLFGFLVLLMQFRRMTKKKKRLHYVEMCSCGSYRQRGELVATQVERLQLGPLVNTQGELRNLITAQVESLQAAQ